MPPLRSKPKNSARIAAYLDGQRGETLAAWWLRLQLYRIVAQRYKTPVGEIDLIAERFGVTAFVEVKTRRHAFGFAEALEAVNQQRISRAAQYWLARQHGRPETTLRFDVIFLAPRQWPRHLKNAFDGSW